MPHFLAWPRARRRAGSGRCSDGLANRRAVRYRRTAGTPPMKAPAGLVTGISRMGPRAVCPVGGCPLGVLAVQVPVDGADGRVAHEGSQADLDAEPLRQPGDEHCREQGVAAEVEEVVLGPG